MGLTVQTYNINKVRLWVVDQANHRVLRWEDALSKPNGAAADGVLGQPDFTSKAAGTGQAQFSSPTSLALENSGRLWVGNEGKGHIFRFENAAGLANGAPAHAILETPPVNALATDAAGRLWVAQRTQSLVRCYASPVQASGPVIPLVTLGGPDIHSNTGDRPSAEGIAIDPQTQKVFVAEPYNNRVLRYGSAAGLASGQAPEAVLGQFGFFTTSTSSGAGGMSGPQSLAITPNGALWISDTGNHRVLRFDHAATLLSGSKANFVVGQTSFNAVSPAAASISSLNQPGGLCTDGFSLWVADHFHHRVLRFDDVHTPTLAPNAILAQAVYAARVYGQSSFNAGESGLSAGRLASPYGLALDPSGRLWVADYGNRRVLSWPSNAASSTSADKVLGQSGFGAPVEGAGPAQLMRPWGLALDASGRLWVSDEHNHRIQRWDKAASKANGTNASGVLGQQSLFNLTEAGCSADRVKSPRGLCVDGKNRLFVADSGNTRILRFSPVFPVITEWKLVNGANINMGISFKGEPNTLHDIEVSFDLKSWITAKSVMTSAGGVHTTTLTSMLPNLFYRVSEP